MAGSIVLLLQKSIISLCEVGVGFNKLQVDGIICIEGENEGEQIVVKVHHTSDRSEAVPKETSLYRKHSTSQQKRRSAEHTQSSAHNDTVRVATKDERCSSTSYVDLTDHQSDVKVGSRKKPVTESHKSGPVTSTVSKHVSLSDTDIVSNSDCSSSVNITEAHLPGQFGNRYVVSEASKYTAASHHQSHGRSAGLKRKSSFQDGEMTEEVPRMTPLQRDHSSTERSHSKDKLIKPLPTIPEVSIRQSDGVDILKCDEPIVLDTECPSDEDLYMGHDAMCSLTGATAETATVANRGNVLLSKPVFEVPEIRGQNSQHAGSHAELNLSDPQLHECNIATSADADDSRSVSEGDSQVDAALDDSVQSVNISMNREFPCHLGCRTLLTDINAYESHCSDVHNLFVCRLCLKTFTNKGNLKRHTRMHTGQLQHRCNLCGQGFVRKDQLNDHVLRHTESQPYKCSLCSKAYSDRKPLRTHWLQKHGMPLKHLCFICYRGFGDTAAYQLHIVSAHNDMPVNPVMGGASQRVELSCRKCSYTANDWLTLAKHNVYHVRDRLNYKCLSCMKEFTDPVEYSLHFKLHAGETGMFECCFCQTFLMTYHELVKHEYQHAVRQFETRSSHYQSSLSEDSSSLGASVPFGLQHEPNTLTGSGVSLYSDYTDETGVIKVKQEIVTEHETEDIKSHDSHMTSDDHVASSSDVMEQV